MTRFITQGHFQSVQNHFVTKNWKTCKQFKDEKEHGYITRMNQLHSDFNIEFDYILGDDGIIMRFDGDIKQPPQLEINPFDYESERFGYPQRLTLWTDAINQSYTETTPEGRSRAGFLPDTRTNYPRLRCSFFFFLQYFSFSNQTQICVL